jgi:hypothetical protein
MDYNRVTKKILVLFITGYSLYGCLENEKKKGEETYYVELINFNDSLKDFIFSSIKGKVSFHKNKKLEIFSRNYITENFPDMHYFKPIEEIREPVEPGIQKIQIVFDGNYSIDSIKYFMKKYTFNNKQWRKTSDMGFVKGVSSYKNQRVFALKEYGTQIINNIAAYTYD